MKPHFHNFLLQRSFGLFFRPTLFKLRFTIFFSLLYFIRSKVIAETELLGLNGSQHDDEFTCFSPFKINNDTLKKANTNLHDRSAGCFCSANYNLLLIKTGNAVHKEFPARLYQNTSRCIFPSAWYDFCIQFECTCMHKAQNIITTGIQKHLPCSLKCFM